MKFKVEIDKDRIYKVDLEEELRINEPELNKHLTTQPTQYGRVADIAARAKAKVERLEYDLEELEYNLDLSIREEAAKTDEKITEAKVKALVKTSASRTAMVNRLLEAKEQMEVVLAAREALAHRKDCLISLGANLRSQMDTELTIKKR